MSILNINAAAKESVPFCTSLYNTGASGVNWMTTNGKSLAVSTGAAAKSAWGHVSAAFSFVMQKLGNFFKEAAALAGVFYSKAKDAFVALPKEGKIAIAIAIVATAIASVTCMKCFSSKEVAPTTTAASSSVATEAGAANNDPARAQQQALANEAAQVVNNAAAQQEGVAPQQPVVNANAAVEANAQQQPAVAANAAVQV